MKGFKKSIAVLFIATSLLLPQVAQAEWYGTPVERTARQLQAKHGGKLTCYDMATTCHVTTKKVIYIVFERYMKIVVLEWKQ